MVKLWSGFIEQAVDDLEEGIKMLVFLRHNPHMRRKKWIYEEDIRRHTASAMSFIFDDSCCIRNGLKATDIMGIFFSDIQWAREGIIERLKRNLDSGPVKYLTPQGKGKPDLVTYGEPTGEEWTLFQRAMDELNS